MKHFDPSTCSGQVYHTFRPACWRGGGGQARRPPSLPPGNKALADKEVMAGQGGN